MPRIHCAKKMNEIVKAIEAFQIQHPNLYVNARPECVEDSWGPNYAIVEFELENFDGGEYFDYFACKDDVYGIVKKILGPKFKVSEMGAKRVKGQLYVIFHGREIEIYREGFC